MCPSKEAAKIDSVFFDDLFSYRFDSKQFIADETDLIFYFDEIKPKIIDKINNYLIFTEEAIYKKNEEIISTLKKSKGISLDDNVSIKSKNFIYNKFNLGFSSWSF